MPCQLVCWTVLLRPEKHHSFATRRPFVICYVSRSGIRTRSCVPLRNYDPKITILKGQIFYPLIIVHATWAYIGWIQHSQIIRALFAWHLFTQQSSDFPDSTSSAFLRRPDYDCDGVGVRLRRFLIINSQATGLGFSRRTSPVNCLPSGLLERFSKTSKTPFVRRKTSFYYPYRFGVRTRVRADTKLRPKNNNIKGPALLSAFYCRPTFYLALFWLDPGLSSYSLWFV